MSIHFVCDHCGHPIDVNDHLAAVHGHCKHCGALLVVPSPGQVPAPGPAHLPAPEPGPSVESFGPALRLRPLEGEEPPGTADHLLAPPSPLKVLPALAEPRPRPQVVSDPDSTPSPEASSQGGRIPGTAPAHDYTVLDPFEVSRTHSSLGPPPLWTLLPSLTARFFARQFRTLRDRLYVVSLFFLVLVLIGYLFQAKVLLHLGALGVIAANVGMLAAGIAYLVTLPFKESLRHGLATLFVPFYAIYYWATRWSQVKTAVSRTLGSFLPIFLVAFAYFIYEEAPVVERALEHEIPALEQALEKHVPALDRQFDQALQPLEKKVDPLPDAKPGVEQGESPATPARSRRMERPPF